MIYIDLELRYESTSRFITEMSMNLCVSALINLMYGDSSETFSLVALFTAFGLLVLVLCVLAYLTLIPIIYFEDLKKDPHLFARHCFTFMEFKDTHIKCYLYYSYFIARRLGVAFVVVCMKDAVRAQIVTLFFLFVWICRYHFEFQPFKNSLINFLSCINEAFLVVFV